MSGGAIREPSLDERLETAHVIALERYGAVLHGRLIDVSRVHPAFLARVRSISSDLQVLRSRMRR